MRALVHVPVLCLLVLPFSSQGRVHVVDQAGRQGVDFTDLTLAVSTAADGDVLLVRSGDYARRSGAIDLFGKGLTVVADLGATVNVSLVRVLNLPAGRFALMQGLKVSSPSPAVELADDQGPVWFEGCRLEPLAVMASTPSSVDRCETVVLSRCLMLGPMHPFQAGLLGALKAGGSRIFLYDSRVEALDPGATCVSLSAGHLSLSGSSVLGGDGASGTPFSCDGGDGGAGLLLINTGQASFFDSVLEGGTGGVPLGSCNAGGDGDAVFALAGSGASVIRGESRSLQVVSPVRDDEFLQATFTGQPGDQVWIRYSSRPGTGSSSRRVPGGVVLGSPSFGRFLGTLPASGTLASRNDIRDLAPGVESKVLFCQAFFREARSGRFVASAPSAVVVLDSSF